MDANEEMKIIGTLINDKSHGVSGELSSARSSCCRSTEIGRFACLHELSSRVDSAQYNAAEDETGDHALAVCPSPGCKYENGQLAIGRRKVHICQRSSKCCTDNETCFEVPLITGHFECMLSS